MVCVYPVIRYHIITLSGYSVPQYLNVKTPPPVASSGQATSRKYCKFCNAQSTAHVHEGISTYVHFWGEREKKHPNHGGRCHHAAAIVLNPWLWGIETLANVLCNKAASLKLDKIIITNTYSLFSVTTTMAWEQHYWASAFAREDQYGVSYTACWRVALLEPSRTGTYVKYPYRELHWHSTLATRVTHMIPVT